ncbi:hypothetical protein [Deinococcus ruber]|uniref:Uncharacterized protein n=1 Tax=Deinococcus ruber TaxID=1848197 RepID=A0A918CAN9_9DEIO|nr:hypothetical protein [Deinococcus ruber]GGR13072.1 hypothetical protein GCM10008957_27530 [Deinococcus ruber]
MVPLNIHDILERDGVRYQVVQVMDRTKSAVIVPLARTASYRQRTISFDQVNSEPNGYTLVAT